MTLKLLLKETKTLTLVEEGTAPKVVEPEDGCPAGGGLVSALRESWHSFGWREKSG